MLITNRGFDRQNTFDGVCGECFGNSESEECILLFHFVKNTKLNLKYKTFGKIFFLAFWMGGGTHLKVKAVGYSVI